MYAKFYIRLYVKTRQQNKTRQISKTPEKPLFAQMATERSRLLKVLFRINAEAASPASSSDALAALLASLAVFPGRDGSPRSLGSATAAYVALFLQHWFRAARVPRALPAGIHKVWCVAFNLKETKIYTLDATGLHAYATSTGTLLHSFRHGRFHAHTKMLVAPDAVFVAEPSDWENVVISVFARRLEKCMQVGVDMSEVDGFAAGKESVYLSESRSSKVMKLHGVSRHPQKCKQQSNGRSLARFLRGCGIPPMCLCVAKDVTQERLVVAGGFLKCCVFSTTDFECLNTFSWKPHPAAFYDPANDPRPPIVAAMAFRQCTQEIVVVIKRRSNVPRKKPFQRVYSVVFKLGSRAAPRKLPWSELDGAKSLLCCSDGTLLAVVNQQMIAMA
jgi:hypothetical protein